MGNRRRKSGIESKVFYEKWNGIKYRIKTSQLKAECSANSSISGEVSIRCHGKEIFRQEFVVTVNGGFKEYIDKIKADAHIPNQIYLKLGILGCLYRIYRHHKAQAIQLGKVYKRRKKERKKE
ncbi:hypothetical protein KAJ38_03045 [Candidatus Pacearchaeota archaeon]|nr:hypothetical protein [Candidatus Pacearchaeota archaeon]